MSDVVLRLISEIVLLGISDTFLVGTSTWSGIPNYLTSQTVLIASKSSTHVSGTMNKDDMTA